MAEVAAQETAMAIQQLFSIEGKVALVTGGSRGIGRMIAQAYVQNGVKVYISARKADACNQTADELSQWGTCISLPTDVSTTEGRKQLVEELQNREQGLNILVNNAGAAWGAAIEEYPEEGYDKVMDLNVKSVFMLTRDLLGLLENAAKPDDPARVINVGSVDGIMVPSVDNFAYAPSKAAVHHMTRVFAVRLADRGLTVNAIAPGPFETKMTKWMLDNFQETIEANCPRGRIGTPEDIAGVAIYLASRAGAYINGAVIPVDGGICIK